MLGMPASQICFRRAPRILTAGVPRVEFEKSDRATGKNRVSKGQMNSTNQNSIEVMVLVIQPSKIKWIRLVFFRKGDHQQPAFRTFPQPMEGRSRTTAQLHSAFGQGPQCSREPPYSRLTLSQTFKPGGKDDEDQNNNTTSRIACREPKEDTTAVTKS